MTVFTVYMATIVVCLVAILIVFELIDQRLAGNGEPLTLQRCGVATIETTAARSFMENAELVHCPVSPKLQVGFGRPSFALVPAILWLRAVSLAVGVRSVANVPLEGGQAAPSRHDRRIDSSWCTRLQSAWSRSPKPKPQGQAEGGLAGPGASVVSPQIASSSFSSTSSGSRVSPTSSASPTAAEGFGEFVDGHGYGSGVADCR